ncbi:MAG: hypothetical protein MZU95_02475 [Desulfomicrobium escambiense]|nr:hypothetical protein [Desulfomicrobium escambiense]
MCAYPPPGISPRWTRSSTGRWCAYGVAAAASRLRRLTREADRGGHGGGGRAVPGAFRGGLQPGHGQPRQGGHPLGDADRACGRRSLRPAASPARWTSWTIAGITMRTKSWRGLGKAFAVDGVYFKPYACCRWIHCALDGLCDLMERHGLRADDIGAIEVHTFARALRLNNHPDPDTLESAQYSLPFCLAAAAVEGQDGLLPMRTSLLHRPDLVALAGRVSLHVDAELDRMFPECTAARVVLRTASGDALKPTAATRWATRPTRWTGGCWCTNSSM